jgi:arsenite oxidase small subunit
MESKRRKFIEICVAAGSACAVGGACGAAQPAETTPGKAAARVALSVTRKYARVKLVDADGKAIKARSLKANHNYVFHYPYESTPCFLLNLDQPLPPMAADAETAAPARDAEDGKGTRGTKGTTGAKATRDAKDTKVVGASAWPGGVGANKAIVAYSAICAHKMAYPTRQVSFIGFRASPSATNTRGKVITCCADKSVYDPFRGAQVLSGPAPQPLAAILLEHDAKTDELFAVGTLGVEKFDEFFQKYDFKLALDVGSRAREAVSGTAKLLDLAAFSAQTAQC